MSENNTKKPTFVVNFISGPGCGKSTIAAITFAALKCNETLKKKQTAAIEYVQEFAKQLVWQKKWDQLNDQHYVSRKQYELLKQIDGNVDIIVCDYSLLHGIYYNENNPDNVSNVEKTNKAILKWYHEFRNINIFLNRGSFDYEQCGRIQSKQEATEIDVGLKKLLHDNQVEYTEFTADTSAANIDSIVDFVVARIKMYEQPI